MPLNGVRAATVTVKVAVVVAVAVATALVAKATAAVADLVALVTEKEPGCRPR